MHCPNCAAKASAGQQFCRACGFNMEKVWQLLAEQLPEEALDEHSTESVARIRQKQRKVERWLGIALIAFAVPLVSALFWMIIYKMIILNGQVLAAIALLTFIIAAIVSLILVGYRESLNEELTKRKLPKPKLTVTEADAHLLTEPNFQPMSSVTERTTELLALDKKVDTKEI